MSEGLYQAIFRRRSVRKYKEGPLDQGTLDRLTSFIPTIRPLFPGIRTEIRVLGREESKGMFKSPASHFLALFSEEVVGDTPNAGFMLQQADLFLSAMGVGTCWQGIAKPAKAVKGSPGLEYVMMLAFGLPAEAVHRTEVSEFKRKSLAEISEVQGHQEIMEAARLAPSGMNNQSWWFSGNGEGIDAFAARSMISERINRINVGIALCHMWLAAEHEGRMADFVQEPGPAKAPPKGFDYVATMRV